MPSLAEFQRGMRDQALDRMDRALLSAWVKDIPPFTPEDRLGIHRNNTVLGLSAALKDAFPVVARLVGDEFFGVMAKDFLRAHPPTRAPLLFWGGEFAGFIAGYEPAKSVPYLTCVAKLEAAWTHAYHAADASPMPPEALNGFPADRLGDVILDLQPSLRFVATAYPAHLIWQANQPGAPEDATLTIGPIAETLLVFRPRHDVIIQPVCGGAFAFLMALGMEETIAVAWEAALGVDPEFDLSGQLAQFLAWGLFTKGRLE